jgi:hypothetical protein
VFESDRGDWAAFIAVRAKPVSFQVSAEFQIFCVSLVTLSEVKIAN